LQYQVARLTTRIPGGAGSDPRAGFPADPTPSTAEGLESRRFRSAAEHYLVGRAPYPPALIAEISERLELRPTDRMLDLGCGPGPLAIAFAPRVGSVLAIDPEPEMLRVAAAAASAAGVALSLLEGSSRTLGADLGRFRLVTIGRAFHWMDRSETLARLDALIEPDGALVLFDESQPDVLENAAVRAWQAVIDRHAHGDAERERRRSPDWPRHETLLLDSPFHRVEKVCMLERRQTSVASLVERALSVSSTTRARLGEGAQALVQEIRAAVNPHASSGMVSEVIEWTAHIARRGHGEGRG
jgi:SAM-dependent methyltransferase